MYKRICASLLVLSLTLLGGCMTLEGAGKLSIGYASTSEVYVGHSVDGDKEGKKAKSSADFMDGLMRLMKEMKADQPDNE